MRLPNWTLPLGFFVVAVFVRLPYYSAYPAPTDETDEILLAYRMIHDGTIPLTADDPYLGPHMVYLAAAAFRLLGPSFEAARTISLLLGALFVPATYWLAEALAGRRAAVIAALLALCAFGQVVIGSHVFWSHGSAPALLALAVACVAKAGGNGPGTSARWPLLAGLFLGLGLSAHPTTATFWPGIAAAVLATQTRPARHLVRSAGWLTAGLVVAYLPGILFLQSHGLTAFVGRTEERAYVGLDLASWPEAVLMWVEGVGRNLLGPAVATPTDPRIWIGAAVVILALAVAVRQRRWLVAGTLVSGALIMSLGIAPDRFRSFTGLRYTATALPLVLAGTAAWLAPMTSSGGKRRWLGGAVIAGIAGIQVLSLAGFYRFVDRDGVTAEPVITVVRGLVAAERVGHVLLLDDEIETKLGGGGEVGRAVKALVRIAGAEATIANVDKMRWFLANGDGATYDMLLSGDYANEFGIMYDEHCHR